MFSPILFFMFILGIDLLLKSQKKKNEAARTSQNSGTQQKQNQPEKPWGNPMQELKKILEQELDKERQKAKPIKNVKQNPVAPEVVDRTLWDDSLILKSKSEAPKPFIVENKNLKNNLKKDILRGIIFSEILSEPKSRQNTKRSS